MENVIKEKQFKLILREPGRGDKELARGSEKFVAEIRLKESLKYNPDFLIIQEVTEDEDKMMPEVNLKGVVISLVLSLLILLVYGKKK